MSGTAQVSRPRRHFRIVEQSGRDSRGRKREHEDTAAVRVNWTNKLLWTQIELAARECGPLMPPRDIVRALRNRNPVDFSGLTPQVVGRWIDRSGPGAPRWRDEVLARANRNGGVRPGGQATNSGVLVCLLRLRLNLRHLISVMIQSFFPELVQRIVDQLQGIRRTGVSVSVDAARGLMLANIKHSAAHIFDTISLRDGTRFMCSDSFVRRFLYRHLRWVPRAATRAAQKVPADADQQLLQLFLRLALLFRDSGKSKQCCLVFSLSDHCCSHS